MTKLEQFKKEFPEIVPSNLANICLWLDHDCGLPPDEILNIIKNVNAYMYVRVLEYLTVEEVDI